MTDWRDEVEEIDPRVIPSLRQFPIESYARILASGKAAAGTRRYATREEAKREATTVIKLITYYREFHPALAPKEQPGYRVWESAEDGRYRWAILPEARPRRARRAA